MKFLSSRHVLALILTILVIELGVRIGAYEPIVNPASHSGITIKLKQALQKYGKANVRVVTFGDSRAVQGLDNFLIYTASKEYGINHVRMSMPGSHFLTFKTLAAWSTAELPALQGIVLAVSMDVFSRLGNGPYELAGVLPLRNKTSAAEMLHHVPFNHLDLRTYTPFYSIAGYREDIKELFTGPGMRLEAVSELSRDYPLDFLAFNARETSDICAVSTRDPAACLDELSRRRSDIPDKAWKALEFLCKAATQDSKRGIPGQAERKLIEEWVAFLENLSRNVRVMVILLPDHSIFMQDIYQPNATYVAREVMTELQAKGAIDLVDLHDLIINQSGRECGLYMDARHLNNQGKQVLTQALLPHLQRFWNQLGNRGRRRE